MMLRSAVVAALIAAWFAAPTGAMAGTARFSAPASAVAGREPSGLVAADFDRDGNPDVATADFRSATVSVLRGRGDGSLERRVAYRVTRRPEWVLAPDLNGDGWPDVVTASSDRNGTVSVLLGDGAGRLVAGARYPVGAGWPAAGDVDEDGAPDVVAGSEHRGLVVLRGTGDGKLAAGPRIAGPYSTSIALADVGGDGHLDAVALTIDGRLVVFRGTGRGGFDAPVTFRTGGDVAVDLNLADLDRDGDPDAVITELDADRVIVMHNTAGRFEAPARYRMPDGPFGTRVADFDGDGVPDIATGSLYRDPVVWPGLGDGTFAPFSRIPWFGNTAGDVADFNRDGRPDLAFADGDGVLVSVYLNWTGLAAPPCVVLNVLHWSLRKAKRYIGFGGCRTGIVTYRGSSGVRKGRVIEQQPFWGAVRPSGSTVDVVVSLGRAH